MSSRKKQKKKGRLLFPISILIITLLCTPILLDQQRLINNNQKRLKEVSGKIESQKKENKKLEAQLKNINSKEYIEKVARESLNMVKPGERIFIDVNK